MQTLPLVFVLSLAALAGCSGAVVIANAPDGGGSSGSSSGSGGSGSASSGTAGSGSVSSGSAGSGSASSGAVSSGAVTVGVGGTDAGQACFTDSVGADYKACTVDTDCVVKDHQTDCCGTTHTLGVNSALSSAYDACESAWDRHFPGCGCSPNVTTADDGSSVTSLYPVTVQCLPTSAGGKTCQTSVSAGVCTTNADCAGNRLCEFPEIAGCSAKGTCFPPGPTCPPGYVPGCACDGTEVNIAHCEIQHGYQVKPLRHQGACVDGG